MKHNISLILVIGLLLKKMPLVFIQPVLKKSMKIMSEQHNNIFTRILHSNNAKDVNVLIDAIDIPFLFYITITKNGHNLQAIKRTENVLHDAKISGHLTSLLELFEGTIDGDAAFFSKQLTIEGSTALVVALRNAIDSADINLVNDLSLIFSPFDSIAKKFITIVTKKYNIIQTDLDIIVDDIKKDTNDSLFSLDNKLNSIISSIELINKTINQADKQQIRKKSDYQQS